MVLAAAGLVVLVVGFGIRNRGLPLRETLINMIPFLVLMVVWMVSALVIRLRQLRELRREMDELNEIVRANAT